MRAWLGSGGAQCGCPRASSIALWPQPLGLCRAPSARAQPPTAARAQRVPVAPPCTLLPQQCAARSHLEQYVRVEDHAALQQERDFLNTKLLGVQVGAVLQRARGCRWGRGCRWAAQRARGGPGRACVRVADAAWGCSYVAVMGRQGGEQLHGLCWGYGWR